MGLESRWGGPWRPAHPGLPDRRQICLMIGMAHVLVICRVLVAALFSSALPFLGEQVTTAVVVTGSLVHYVTASSS